MPMTPWTDMVGLQCEICDGYATHIYHGVAMCCDCHGGYIYSQVEAEFWHFLLKSSEEIRQYVKNHHDEIAHALE